MNLATVLRFNSARAAKIIGIRLNMKDISGCSLIFLLCTAIPWMNERVMEGARSMEIPCEKHTAMIEIERLY